MRPEQKTILKSELENLRIRIIQNHIAANQKASGKTIKSLLVEVDENAGELTGRGFMGVLETGRKAGKVPKGFRDIILKWVQAKGINVDNPKSFAFLVARKIANEGTLLHRTGGRTDIYSNEIPKTIENVLKRLGEDQVNEIKNIFINAEKVTA